MIIFAVFDKKAEYFLEPMIRRNAAQMIRDLGVVVMDPQSMLSKYPADYSLYQLAFFDESSGAITDCDKIKLGDIDSLYDMRKAVPFPDVKDGPDVGELFAGRKE